VGERSEIKQFWVTMITDFRALHERKICSRSRTSQQSFVSVDLVYSVNIDNILMQICDINETVHDLLRVHVVRGR
jgi:hypothetical protein